MSVHNGGWKTIRYAIDSTSRTLRLCLILLLLIAATVVLRASWWF